MDTGLEILITELDSANAKIKAYEEVLNVIRSQQFDKFRKENACTSMIDTVLNK